MERLTERHYKASDGYYMKCSGTCSEGCCEGCHKGEEFVDRLGQIEDILGDDYDLDRLRELVETDKRGRILITNDEMATAMQAGAYVLRDDDLAGAGLYWKPRSRKGEELYILYYKASEILKKASEAALGKGAGQ